ncbi:SurA N-terminal domain-containing protein [Kistimonas asteriae]|uniref:SurA N-terminal domain-containing protein n=1 Tax=Kistimonas asteriae TaxID=517724 RepID=UPI001BA484E7|nr:SurA N-terminal domain-containing protein [Kistimonas asteriae]
MLQNMRDKAQGWIAKAIIAFIAFTFAIFGLESLAPNPNNPEVAEVNGQEITQQQLMQAVDQQRRLLMQQLGGNFDPSMFNDQMLQQAALEGLIQKEVVRQYADKVGMSISAQSVDQLIRSTPEFQVDGQFDANRFQQLVRSLGMTPVQFRQYLREELLASHIRASIAGSEFATPYEVQMLTDIQQQTRDVAWLTLDVAAARKAVKVDEETITSYYQDHQAEYMTPEQVSLEYVVLDRSKLAEQIEVSEADIKARYDARVADQKEKADNTVTASMILLESSETRDEKATLALADELRQRMNKGEDFSVLAREYSEEPDSAAKGGDLGAVETGFLGAAFDEALAALTKGEVSQPVLTDFGVVLIKRTAGTEVDIPTLAAMRNELVREFKESAVDPLFVEQSQKLADISFEAADLQQPAEELGLDVQATDLFGRRGGEGVAENRAVIDAAFSDDVLNLQANSEPLDIGPGKVAVVRIKEHKQPEVKPLSDVRDAIVAQIQQERADQQLNDKAGAILAELGAGKTGAEVAEAYAAEWQIKENARRGEEGVPQQLLMDAFKLPHPQAGMASYGKTALPNGDVVVVAVNKVVQGTEAVESEQVQTIGNILSMRMGEALFGEYQQDLKNTADVKRFAQDSES